MGSILKVVQLLMFCLCAVFSISSNAEKKPFRFVVPDFKPYTYVEDGAFKGIGVDLVTKLMKDLDQSYEIELVPTYGRAVIEIKRGNADGLFLASKNAERDAIAVFTDPLATNNWSWFFKLGSVLNPRAKGFKEQVEVGTFLHTNTHKWLLDNGYRVSSAVTKVELLPKMLELDRLDAVFLAEVVFNESAVQANIADHQFVKIVEVSKPFGLYISKQYLSGNPDFLEKINGAIGRLQKQ